MTVSRNDDAGVILQLTSVLTLAAFSLVCRVMAGAALNADALYSCGLGLCMVGVSDLVPVIRCRDCRRTSIGKWMLACSLFLVAGWFISRYFGAGRIWILIWAGVQSVSICRRASLFTVLELLRLGSWSVVLSCFIAGVVWGSGYLTPTLDRSLAQGTVHQDTLLHVSISSMLQVSRVSSSGLDGLPYYGYHWGSHALLAMLCSIAGIPVHAGYALVYPIVFVPLLLRMAYGFFGVFSRTRRVSERGNDLVGLAAMICIVWPVSLLSYHGGVPAGMSYVIPWISESLLVSLVFAFATLCIAGELAYRPRVECPLADVLCLMVLVAFVTLCKITTGYTLVVWLLTIALSRFLSTGRWEYVIAGGIVALIALATVKLVFVGGGIVVVRSLRDIVMSVSRFGFVRNLFTFLLPALLILLDQTLGCRQSLVSWLQRRMHRAVAGLMLTFLPLFVLTPAPALLLSFSDDEKYFFWSAILFSGPAAAVSIGRLLGYLRPVSNRLFAAVVMLCSVGLASNESLDVLAQMWRSRAEVVSMTGPRAEFLRVIQEAGTSLSGRERTKACLFVPADERKLVLSDDLLADLFLPTAVSGLPQVLGGPTVGSRLADRKGFSLGTYVAIGAEERTEERALRRAREAGFTTLLTVRMSEGKFAIVKTSVK